MTVIISRKEKLETMLAKLEKLEERSKERKAKTFVELSGKLSKLFKGDPVKIQRNLRNEWEK